MFEFLRERIADRLEIMAQRLSLEPRYPYQHRVPYSPRTVAGVSVTPDTAITVATVWACLRYLSQTIAVLPWHVKRDGKNGPEIQRTHPIDYLLWKRPNVEWSSFQFRETLTHWALRWGNGYAEIERDQLGRPFALWPIHPERVRVCRDPDTQDLYYEVSNAPQFESAGSVAIAAEDMFHIRGFGEGPVGVNVMAYASQSIGWARAAQIFAASYFGNGMNIAGVVINKKPLKPEGLKRQRQMFEDLYRGSARGHKTAFIDNDADWKPIGVDPRASQLVESQQHLVEECCRWFGVPPHKVMHLLRATFTNIESQGIEVVVDSISPWAKRFEDEADWKLFGQNRQGYYTKMNMTALMRGDAPSRVAYYQAMREIGALSVNRILEMEDENTIGPDGDMHVIQAQYRTLDWVADQQAVPGQTEPDEIDQGTSSPQKVTQEPGEDVSAATDRAMAMISRVREYV